MSMSADLSLMDFLFEREDPVFNQTDKDIINRNDQKDIEGIAVESWSNPDDFLESILKFEHQPFEILNDAELLPAETTLEIGDVTAPTSSSSDSGVSSDQQLSPMLHEVEEDDTYLLSSLSNGSESNPSEASHMCADQESSVQEDIEVDSSVFDILNTGCLGEVRVEDNQAIFSMNVLPPLQKAVQNSHIMTTNTPLRQLIRVMPVSGNPRSILLPISLKDVKDIKTLKLINASSQNAIRKQQFVTGMHVTTGSRATVQTKPILVKSIAQQDDLISIGSSKESVSEETGEDSDSQYPRLQLTPEEKRLLQKEGVILPSHYPLTKHEERELKRIRRKIRNKISAQDSRKRKKEYIDGLEERVKQCTEENLHLAKRIKALQTQNQTLAVQLKRLQAVLSRGTAKTAQPATCLMVLLLSMALIMAPNLRLNQSSSSNSDTQKDQDLSQPENTVAPHAGRSRNLLEIPKSKAFEDGTFSGFDQDDEAKFISDMAELLQFNNPLVGDHDYEPPPLKRSRIDEKPEDIKPSLLSAGKNYIVPPPDEIWPPPGSEDGHISNMLEKTLGEEMKVNISNDGGTRTVVLQVPKEQ